MKLHTEIKPRKDGTVKVAGADGKQYVFQREEDTGELACDIEDQATVAMLLNGGQFWPANEADHAAATALIEQSDSEGEAEDDGEDEDYYDIYHSLTSPNWVVLTHCLKFTGLIYYNMGLLSMWQVSGIINRKLCLKL